MQGRARLLGDAPAARLAAVLLACAVVWPRASSGATRTYVIAIGNNAPPASGDAGGETLRPLHYADDDAADFYSFTRELSAEASLLTVLDRDSQQRFPELTAAAQPPTLAELRRTVERYRQRLERDRAGGVESVLLFFYSGHGSRSFEGQPALTLLDGALTQQVLYDEILARLPARFVHILVDACHAEAVVRPRDAQAEVVELTDEQLHGYVARATLERFPHVGALVASSSATESHEWDLYQRGVFTHEVLSGLRGAADVNGDGLVEYSELYAFLSAANREVSDARARLAIVVRPPAVNRRAALVDLTALRSAASLVGDTTALGGFHVEDARGNRLADVRGERGFRVSLAVPADRTLFVRTLRGEAEIHPRAGTRLELERIAMRPARTATRGAMESAMRRGLFATPFGPIYYRGFVDGHSEVLGVQFSDSGMADLTTTYQPRSRLGVWLSLGTAGALGISAGIFAGLSLKARDDYDHTRIEREAVEARDRFYLYRDLGIGAGIAAGVAVGVGTWLLWRALRSPAVTPAVGMASGASGLAVHF